MTTMTDASPEFDTKDTRTEEVVLGVDTHRGEAFEQAWAPGGMCPECGSQLGPVGQQPCEEPYLGERFQIIIG